MKAKRQAVRQYG